MESGKQVDAVNTNFSNAFDRVQHDILFLKLEKIGIHGALLAWIISYLTGRWQYVKNSNHCSKAYMVKSGVPQGSHL